MVSKNKSPTNINNEKRKISFDIIELLDGKVNKRIVYCVLWFYFINLYYKIYFRIFLHKHSF
jgi:hypothetical protein